MALADIQEVAHGSPDLGAPVKIGGVASSSAPINVQEGARVNASFDLAGKLRVSGDGSSVAIEALPELSPHFNNAATNTITTVKPSAGFIGFLEASHPNPNDIFIQFFDSSVSITVGSTTPIYSLIVPAGDGTLRGAMDKHPAMRLIFSNSIKYAVTTTPTGSTAPASNATVNIGYN